MGGPPFGVSRAPTRSANAPSGAVGKPIKASQKADGIDFIYLDPPYASDEKPSFVEYTRGGFNETQHIELFNLCHELTNKKVRLMMSNGNVSLVRSHFHSKRYIIQEVSCRRSINSKNPAMTTKELIIRNII